MIISVILITIMFDKWGDTGESNKMLITLKVEIGNNIKPSL